MPAYLVDGVDSSDDDEDSAGEIEVDPNISDDDGDTDVYVINPKTGEWVKYASKAEADEAIKNRNEKNSL